MRNTQPRLAACVITAAACLEIGTNSIPLRAGEGDNVVESFTVAKDGRGLLIPIAIDEQQYEFLLDTGSNVTIFDNSLKESLKTEPIDFAYTISEHGIERIRTGPFACSNSLTGRSKLPIG